MNHAVQILIQVLVVVALICAFGWWWKHGQPDPDADFKRGAADAESFHKQGVSIWSMQGYCVFQKARGLAGPYEAGMSRYIKTQLKGIQ